MEMKFKIALSLGLMLALVGLLLQPVAALPTNPKSMNARFTSWQEADHVIHIFFLPDVGTPAVGFAEVEVGQPVLIGFELAYGTIEEAQDALADPDVRIGLSINSMDPDDFVPVKDWFQPAFEAVPGSGPAWTWDHDGDGLGDGDGDGLGDWFGPIIFFRYQSPGFPAGDHILRFRMTFDDGVTVFGDNALIRAA